MVTAKFRAWTSVSSNSLNAQQQGYLSPESSSNQPSWRHLSVPDSWSPSLLCPDGISPPAYHSLIQDCQETDPYVRISNAFWCSCCIQGFWKQSAYWWQVLRNYWLCCCPKKFFTTRTKAFHASNSTSFIEFSNSGSLMNWRTWGPSKIPPFNFSMVYPGKARHK